MAGVPSTVNYYLSRVLHGFHERSPNVRVKVLDAGANEVLATVARGEADFGLNFMGVQEAEVEFTPIADERFVAACRRDHPVARMKRVSWEALRAHDFISVSRSADARSQTGWPQSAISRPKQPERSSRRRRAFYEPTMVCA